MKRLAQMLPESIPQPEALRAARAQLILRNWKDVVGEGMASRSWPERFDHGTVWIAVEGSAWAQELRLLSPTILRKLAQLAHDNEMFRELRFGVRNVERTGPYSPPEPPPKQAELTNMDLQEIIARRLALLEASEADARDR
jgi:predicted nucleic acid-binding Zn ribbon protein